MNRIWMKKPAAWAGELWRESLPIGNGLTSALLCGSVGYEHLWINRFGRWEGGMDGQLPDVSDTLAKVRTLISDNCYTEANELLAKTLHERGYRAPVATPMAPVEIRLRFDCEYPYKHYRRGIDLNSGEAFVRFDQGEYHIERKAFVSRSDDQIVLSICSTGKMHLKIDKPHDERIHLHVSVDHAGSLEDKGDYLLLSNVAELLVLARFDADPVIDTYDTLFARHLPLYCEAMGDADLRLCEGDHPTEHLLDEAAEDEASLELYEKLWHFGRYLFVSGTNESGEPFPLYGLWAGQENLPWAQNVANENVQMIYWHAPVGGHAFLLRPLIHYYFGKMDAFREAARKLFGCRGIYVSTYTTPLNSYPAPNVPVIVNYISCAGWLCRHFYDYYRYTGDEALLKSEILPFMLETAAFYEDYVMRDKAGKITICPSVSPENTPANFIPEDFQAHMGHANPVVWNSTMDFAIMKELLTNLLTLNESIPMDVTRVQTWKTLLNDIPDYMVNADGALREWMDEKLQDFYYHRHLSHLYPLFPGEEIRVGDKLFAACEKAVDLRELGALSGWALAHMAAIYARLRRGNQALDCLNTLAKGCLLPNLFTLHNDWRDMGVSLRIDEAPVQLDALLGSVNALQEMLLHVTPDVLTLLPACPDLLSCGEIRNWHFPGGQISFRWNRAAGELAVSIRSSSSKDIHLIVPSWANLSSTALHLEPGQTLELTSVM